MLNIALFVPFGAGLRLAGWPWRRVVAAAVLLSLAVESLQYFAVTGRDASLSDLLTNTSGGAIGAGVAPHLGTLLGPEPRPARRLFLGGIGLWLGALAISAIELKPWLPPGAIRSDCTRSLGKVEVFAGTVQSVVLNGVPLPCDAEVPEADRLRSELARGEAVLDATTPSGSPSRGKLVIHAVRMPERYALLLSQRGRAATFSPPIAGNRFGFYSPILRLPEGFPDRSGIPVRLQGGIRNHRMWLSSAYSGEHRSEEVTLSPSHGWTGLFALEFRDDVGFRRITAFWIALLMLPAAYWAGGMAHPGWAAGGLLAALAAGLGVLPLAAGYAPVHWSEWAGGLLGIAVGWALHRSATYLESRCGSPSTGAYSSP